MVRKLFAFREVGYNAVAEARKTEPHVIDYA